MDERGYDLSEELGEVFLTMDGPAGLEVEPCRRQTQLQWADGVQIGWMIGFIISGRRLIVVEV